MRSYVECLARNLEYSRQSGNTNLFYALQIFLSCGSSYICRNGSQAGLSLNPPKK